MSDVRSLCSIEAVSVSRMRRHRNDGFYSFLLFSFFFASLFTRKLMSKCLHKNRRDYYQCTLCLLKIDVYMRRDVNLCIDMLYTFISMLMNIGHRFIEWCMMDILYFTVQVSEFPLFVSTCRCVSVLYDRCPGMFISF